MFLLLYKTIHTLVNYNKQRKKMNLWKIYIVGITNTIYYSGRSLSTKIYRYMHANFEKEKYTIGFRKSLINIRMLLLSIIYKGMFKNIQCVNKNTRCVITSLGGKKPHMCIWPLNT